MDTIQITIDQKLLKHVDREIKHLHMTRSAFIRQSLASTLKNLEIARQEERHRLGYQRFPTTLDEMLVCEDDQAWGDIWNAEK